MLNNLSSKQLIKYNRGIYLLKLKSVFLCFTDIDFFGTLSSSDAPDIPKDDAFIWLIKNRRVLDPMSSYEILHSLNNDNKREKSPHKYLVAFESNLSPIFLGELEKFSDEVFEKALLSARKRCGYPFDILKTTPEIGESIVKNYKIIKDNIGESAETSLENLVFTEDKTILLFTNVPVLEDESIPNVDFIWLPNNIRFSSPVDLMNNVINEEFLKKFDLANNNHLVNACILKKDLGVVFIGKREKLFNKDYKQIENLCISKAKSIIIFCTNYYRKEHAIKQIVNIEKLYSTKLNEYISHIPSYKNENKSLLEKKIVVTIEKTIKDYYITKEEYKSILVNNLEAL